MSVLNWRGDALERNVTRGLARGLTRWGLRCETNAKRRLRPSEQDAAGEFIPGGGHGVRTGTLRRSIHIVSPGYNWGSDNAEPTPGSPERGMQSAEPKPVGGKLTLEFGSGMEYALEVHQTHDDPLVFHYLVNSIADEKPKLAGDLKHELRSILE